MAKTASLAPGLRCEQVRQSFGTRVVLAGVDLEFGVGLTGLVGINGAGKTTLMRILAGVARADSGDVTTLGPPTTRARLVPQATSRIPWMSALEYVKYTIFVSGSSDGGRALAALADTGLTSVRDIRVDKLSGGEARRLAIAAAIATNADVLVLDEPTASLDPLQRDSVHALIRTLGETRAVLISSHLTGDIEDLVSSVAVLARGRIEFRGSLPELERATRGQSGSSTIARALAWAESATDAADR